MTVDTPLKPGLFRLLPVSAPPILLPFYRTLRPASRSNFQRPHDESHRGVAQNLPYIFRYPLQKEWLRFDREKHPLRKLSLLSLVPRFQNGISSLLLNNLPLLPLRNYRKILYQQRNSQLIYQQIVVVGVCCRGWKHAKA